MSFRTSAHSVTGLEHIWFGLLEGIHCRKFRPVLLQIN